MKKEIKRNINVGLFVSIGTLIVIAAILLIGNINDTFSSKMEIKTVFEDVKGLQEGDNVWFSGVKIGTVSKLKFIQHSQVEVTLNIDKEAKNIIKQDAKIKLGTDGLIGNKILIIYGGTESAGYIKEHDAIEAVKTLSSEEVMNMLQKNNVNILEITSELKKLTQSLNAGTGTLGKLMQSDSLYNSFILATNQLNSMLHNADNVMHSVNSFADNLNQDGTLLHALTNDKDLASSLDNTIKQMESIADSAQMAISNINELTNDQNSTVGLLLHDEQTGDKVQSTLQNLEESSIKLNENLDAMRENFLFRKYFKKKQKNND